VLTVRKLIQGKLTDLELSLRGIPRGFGLKVGATARRRFPGRVRELVGDHPTLQMITEALLSVREELDRQFAHLEVEVRNLARQDQRVRLLRSTPGLVPLWH
jgi:transposase